MRSGIGSLRCKMALQRRTPGGREYCFPLNSTLKYLRLKPIMDLRPLRKYPSQDGLFARSTGQSGRYNWWSTDFNRIGFGRIQPDEGAMEQRERTTKWGRQ